MIISLEAIRIFMHGCTVHHFSGVISGSSCGMDFRRPKTDSNISEILVRSKCIVNSVKADIALHHLSVAESKRICPHAFFL